MKTKGFMLLAIFVMLLVACNNQDKTTIESVEVNNGDVNYIIELRVLSPEIPVGTRNYLKLVSYIQENGNTVDYTPYYRQYIFTDDYGNIHTARILPLGDTIKKFVPIDVYVDQKYGGSFSYDITEIRAFPNSVEYPTIPKYVEIVKSGYTKLLAHIEFEYLTIGP